MILNIAIFFGCHKFYLRNCFKLLKKKITKQYAVREPISPRTRLEITLRYLASGDTMASVSYMFRVGNITVSKIISETCQVIWKELKEKVFFNPTADNWHKVATEFETLWNFPHCIGAVDGKHVEIDVSLLSLLLLY